MFFLYENNLRLLQNSGPIGLSLMVVLLAIRMLFAENRLYGNNGSLELQNCPKNIQLLCRYSHACFQERSHTNKFLEILNKQNLAIKYIVEFEEMVECSFTN